MGDLALRWDSGLVDLVIEDDDLLSDDELRTAVLLSLFTDRRAEADDVLPADDGDRRGWWADEFAAVEGDRMGSRLWLLDRSKRTRDVERRAEELVREALAWMLEDQVIDQIDVTTQAQGAELDIAVTLHRSEREPVALRFAPVDAGPPAPVPLSLVGVSTQWVRYRHTEFSVAKPEGARSGDMLVLLASFPYSEAIEPATLNEWTRQAAGMHVNGWAVLTSLYRWVGASDGGSYQFAATPTHENYLGGVAILVALRGAHRNMTYDPVNHATGYPSRGVAGSGAASVADSVVVTSPPSFSELTTSETAPGALRGGPGGVVLRVVALAADYYFSIYATDAEEADEIPNPVSGEFLARVVLPADAPGVGIVASLETFTEDQDPLAPVALDYDGGSIAGSYCAMSIPIESAN